MHGQTIFKLFNVRVIKKKNKVIKFDPGADIQTTPINKEGYYISKSINDVKTMNFQTT